MFADDNEIVTRFTRPVVVSTRTWDGTVTSGMAAFVVLNQDGWFATNGALPARKGHGTCRYAVEQRKTTGPTAWRRTRSG